MNVGQRGTARRDFIQSIDRVFAVLHCFTPATPEPTLSEVAERTDLDRSAARRYLLTLESLGYVGRRGTRFHLRPRILELGYSYLSSLSLPRVAQPYLAGLATACGESCSITVLDGTEIAYVAVANAVRSLSITLVVGNRLPAYCTAAGRVLLSGLDDDDDVRQVLSDSDLHQHTDNTVWDADRIVEETRDTRERGWCLVDQDLESGIRSISIPIHGYEHKVIAAATVTTPTSRVSIRDLSTEFRESLESAVAKIEMSVRDLRQV